MYWMTNAQHNRKQACRLFAAGFTPEEIVAFCPQAYRLVDGKVGLQYDEKATEALHRTDATAAEFGLLECTGMVSSEHVDREIEKKRKNSGAIA